MLSLSLFVFAQKTSSPKVEKLDDAITIHKELDVDDAESGYLVIPVEKNGLILAYMPEGKSKNGMQEFAFKKLNTDFGEEYVSKISINKNYNIKTYAIEGDYLYVLFASKSAQLSMFPDYTLVKVNTKEKETKIYLGLPEKTLYFNKMLVNNGVVSLSGKYGPSTGTIYATSCVSALFCYIPLLFIHYKFSPVIINIDMKGKNSIKKEFAMQNYEKGAVEFVDMDVNDSLGEINFIINHDYKKSNKTFLRTLKSGKLSSDINVKKPNGVQITNSKINVVDAENKVIMGTYSKYGKSTSSSQGVYVSMMEGAKQKYFKSIPWNKFKNFNVAKTKAETKAMKRNEKKGKTTDVLIQVIFHDVLVRENELVFFGETYYPRYETRTEVTYVNGRPSYRTYTVFIGYQYVGALAFALDESGELIWDQGFNLTGPLTFYLRERYRFTEIGDNQYAVAYNEGMKLRVQTFDKESSELEIKEVDMQTGKKGDKVKEYYPGSSDINYWYDDFYLATGRQNIKNKNEKGSAKKRNVFYLNKIELPLSN